MSIFSGYSNLKDYFKKTPVTSILIIVLFFITLAQVFFGYFSTESLVKFGALQADLVRGGDYYRLVTVMFLHGSIEHFASNAIIGLFVLGGALERIVKTWRYLVIYFLGGLGGSFAIILTSNNLTVGASGAIFAALGGLLYLSFFRKDIIRKAERKSIWALIIVQLIFTFSAANISIPGHVGGLVAGFILSFIVIKKEKNPSALTTNNVSSLRDESITHNNDPFIEKEDNKKNNDYIH